MFHCTDAVFASHTHLLSSENGAATGNGGAFDEAIGGDSCGGRAAIVILAVLAGVLARVCGGRHLVGEHDLEGWVERKCRSCIDGGIPATAQPPEGSKAVEEKK
ncbi:uncharacterized protein A4U43_C08F9710 [Asparagus officinalis]|nr:uncharacterized protein A4U43_C08F9710 [Asparagus officinalis]